MNMLSNDKILEIQSNPNNFVHNQNIKQLESIIISINDLYYNNNSPLTDYQYDILYDGLKEKYKFYKLNFTKSPCYKVGSDVKSPTKYKLPYYCGSLDKIKPNTNELKSFIRKYKNNFFISEKIDGIPLIIEFNCRKFNIYTRGNGKQGILLDNIILDIIDFPKDNIINKFTYFCVKGECVLNKNSNYNTNLRNVVNGILHKKKIDKNIKLNYIAYEILSPRMNIYNQYTLLKSLNFKIPHFILKNNLSNIENLYKLFREKSNYNIDGLVITHNENYPVEINKNPSYSKAFKMVLNEQIKQTTILNIEWNISKNGLLKPTIIFDNIIIDKTNINKTTGFNAKYIIDNNLGKNSVINIIKSGDVIPYIHSIVKSTEPILPNCDYKWNDSKIDFIITNLENDQYIKSIILHFIHNMEIKYINDGIIDILYKNNYNSIKKIINMTINDFESLPKFNNVLSKKIYNSIQDKIKNPNLLNILIASNVFGNGIGKKKMESILNIIPNLLEFEIDNNLKNKLLSIDGISDITANKILKGLNDFKIFINDLNINNINLYQSNVTSSKLNNINIVFTGFRDKNLEKIIIENGGNIQSSVSKNTNIVIVDKSLQSKKIELAKQLNIKIISKNNFNTLLYG